MPIRYCSLLICPLLIVVAFFAGACGDDGNPVTTTPTTQQPTQPTQPTQPSPSPRPSCNIGMELGPGESCSFSGGVFEVRDDGFGCIGGGSLCAGTGITINNFRASKISGTSRWTINGLP